MASLGMLFSKQPRFSRKRIRGVMSLSKVVIPFMDLRYSPWNFVHCSLTIHFGSINQVSLWACQHFIV